ncbi:MAG TPA: exopolysaccharide biosynthesis polyprenyl glycosylphosphotransferase [Terriglobales bacterium]|nr:exopolysaccharide biosynthesis polyprenyl glycosylphosphotransferase [Terriglobales bacterium]
MALSIANTYAPRRLGWRIALCEAVLVALAGAASLALRFGHDAWLVLRYEDTGKLACFCLGGMLLLYSFDLYELPVLGDLRQIGARLPQVVGAGALVLALLQWRDPAPLGARPWLAALLAAGLGLGLVRAFLWIWNHNPRLSEPVLLVGEGGFADQLRGELQRHAELGMAVSGSVITAHWEELGALAAGARRPRFARRLVAAVPGGWSALPEGLHRRLAAAGYRLEDGSALYERLTGKVPVQAWSQFDPAWRCDAALAPAHLLAKRCFDRLLAALALLLSAPLLLLLALLIRLDSPGPAIFRQVRVGRLGRRFTVYKFRSMRLGAGAEACPACERDPRCTRLGRWLRRLRLDELPQLFNILRGDMSWVGPRPFVPEQEEACLRALPFYDQRLSVSPGATGWAQVNRGYCASLEDNADKLAYDLFYVKHLSFAFDLLILMQTVKVVFLGRGGR